MTSIICILISSHFPGALNYYVATSSTYLDRIQVRCRNSVGCIYTFRTTYETSDDKHRSFQVFFQSSNEVQANIIYNSTLGKLRGWFGLDIIAGSLGFAINCNLYS